MVSKSVSKIQNDYVGRWQELFDKCSNMAQEIEELTETLREVNVCDARYNYSVGFTNTVLQRNNEVVQLRKLYRDTADENKILYEVRRAEGHHL